MMILLNVCDENDDDDDEEETDYWERIDEQFCMHGNVCASDN